MANTPHTQAEVQQLIRHQAIPRKPVPGSEERPASVANSNGAIKAPATSQSTIMATKTGMTLRRQYTPLKDRTFVKWLRRSAWTTEFLSCIIALAALAAIVITLAVHQGKPLPKWPSTISINSLIAIFTSILKAAMLLPIAEGLSELKWIWFATTQPLTDMNRFDSASRGPWGSFKLFFIRPSLLAYLAAGITIIALAIDPFTQQILQYYECLIPSPDGISTVVRTNNYTASGFHTGALEQSLDGPMAAALYQGVLAPPANATASIDFQCASGNCTFPASESVSYRSLAMCTSVDDITHSLTGNGTENHYELPSGLATGDATLFVSAGSGTGNTEDAPLFSFETVMIKCKGGGNASTAACMQTEPWAFRATLYPCIHTYGKVSISKTILGEELLSTTRLPFMNMSDGLYFSLAGNVPSFPGIDCTPSNHPAGNNTLPTGLLRNGMRYITNPYQDAGRTTQMLWFNPACTYEFAINPVLALTEYLSTAFFGLVGDPNELQAPYGAAPDVVGDAWLLRLYAGGEADLTSVNNFMQGLANAMTAIMRQRGDASNSVPATGTMLASTTCIRVHWQWLTLPIALLTLTIVFFFAVVLQSQQYTRRSANQEGRKAWKSSSLPLLWCGLDDETRRRYGTLNDPVTMEDRGNELRVSLSRMHDVGDKGVGRWVLGEAGRVEENK